MAIEQADVSIRCFREDRGNVAAAVLSELVGTSEASPMLRVVADQGPDRSGHVTFFSGGLDDYPAENGHSSYQLLERHLASALQRVSDWLEVRPVGVFAALSGRGYRLDVFLDLWIDQDQLELALPAQLMKTCGERGLPMRIITND